MNSEPKKSNETKDPCKKYACELQYCLQANNYNQVRCESIVNKLKQCCQSTYTASSSSRLVVSDTCSGFV